MKWFFFGEIVPTIQGTVWPYYAVKHFVVRDSGSLYEGDQQREMELPQDGQVIALYKEESWWLPKYAQLNAALDKAGGTLSASYRVGPTGTSHVRVQIERGAGKGLNLILDLPPEALKSADPKAGKALPSKERVIFRYRDHDLDGMPDDVFSESFGEPLSKEEVTNDGFYRIRDSVDHAAFLAQWSIGLAFSTDHFLQDEDSASP